VSISVFLFFTLLFCIIFYNYWGNFGIVLLSRPKALGPGMVAESKSFGSAFRYDIAVRSILLGSDKKLSGCLKINSYN
jgi:hypothetical protein